MISTAGLAANYLVLHSLYICTLFSILFWNCLKSGNTLDDLDSLQVSLAANWSWSKIYHLLQLLDNLDGFLIFHAQLQRYSYDLMTIEIIYSQVLGHIRCGPARQRAKIGQC